MYDPAATKSINKIADDEMDLKIMVLFSLLSFKSRLASITINIRPSVPITGKIGSMSGTKNPVSLTINRIKIPSRINNKTPGIFVYLLVISKRYDKMIMTLNAIMM